jgi:hypothetical protein
MSRVFLHIGMHKTGSTAIQSAFAGYETSRTRYADLGYENHSIPFYTAYSGQHHNYHIWRAAGLRPEEIEAQKDICRARIEAAVAGAGKRNLIFSGEDISLLPREGVEEIHALFARYDCDVQVIIYVREPVSFVQSAIKQMIKDGTLNADVPTPLYRERIEKFIKAFGAERVNVRVFDRARLHGNDIIKDFAKQVGVRAPGKGEKDNPSLSIQAVKIIHLMNQMVPVFGEKVDFVQARRRMVDHVSETFTGRFEVPEALVAGIIKAEDVDWLHSATGIDFRRPEGDFPAFSDKALAAYLGQLDTRTIAAIRAHLMDHCGISNPPEEQHFLLARYFMSFLNTGWPTGFVFDADRYLELNPDVKEAGVNPYKHYLMFGLAKGRRVS